MAGVGRTWDLGAAAAAEAAVRCRRAAPQPAGRGPNRLQPTDLLSRPQSRCSAESGPWRVGS